MKRRSLLCIALPAIVSARPALAWREQPAGDDVMRAWADRCGGGQTAPGPVVLCPFCGCPVSGAADHGEGQVAAP